MATKVPTVDQMYSRRTYPSGRHSAQDAAPLARATIPKPAADEQAPQSYCDKHAASYDNTVPLDSWLRNGDACSKPSFDKQNAWRGGKLRKD
jgi:hypothetical protein